jgi:hypothetical protein
MNAHNLTGPTFRRQRFKGAAVFVKVPLLKARKPATTLSRLKFSPRDSTKAI